MELEKWKSGKMEKIGKSWKKATDNEAVRH